MGLLRRGLALARLEQAGLALPSTRAVASSCSCRGEEAPKTLGGEADGWHACAPPAPTARGGAASSSSAGASTSGAQSPWASQQQQAQQQAQEGQREQQAPLPAQPQQELEPPGGPADEAAPRRLAREGPRGVAPLPKGHGPNNSPSPSPFPHGTKHLTNRLIPRLAEAGTTQQVMEVMHSKRGPPSVKEFTTAFNIMGKLAVKDLELVRIEDVAALFAEATPSFSLFDPQALANTAWGCAKLRYLPPREGRAAFEAAVLKKLPQFKLGEAVTTLFGRVFWEADPRILSHFSKLAYDKRHELDAKGVANTLWGVARTRHAPGNDVVLALVDATLPQLGSLTPMSFASVLFAIAVLRVRPEADNRQLVTTAWALGALQCGDIVTERFWQALEAGVYRTRSDLLSTSMPLFLFGCARLGLKPVPRLLELLQRKTCKLGNHFRSGDFAIVLWSLARLGYLAGSEQLPSSFVKSTVAGFARQIEDPIATGMPPTVRQCAAVCWALAMLRYTELEECTLIRLAHHIERQLEASGGPMTTADATMLLTAFEFYNWAPGLDLLRRHISPHQPAAPEADADMALGDVAATTLTR
eukprot:scaffold7.g3638.t1